MGFYRFLLVYLLTKLFSARITAVKANPKVGAYKRAWEVRVEEPLLSVGASK